MQAAALLDLRVTHPFYDDQRCGDFAIAPDAATAVTLRRLRLVGKTLPDRLRLFAMLDASGKPFAAAAGPVALGFELRARDDSFALITDLAAIAAQPAPLFSNAGLGAADSTDLPLTSRTERGSDTLTVRNPGAAEPFALARQPLAGSGVADFRLEAADFIGMVQGFDAATNRVTVDTRTAKVGQGLVLSYPVLPRRDRTVFAEVALSLDTTLLQPPAIGPRAFSVPLAARALRWCFYLITDFAGDISTLRILDATAGNAPRRVVFSDSRRLDLTQSPDATDATGQDLARRNPGRRILRFLSDAPVACQQSPLRALALQLNGASVVATLPNPSPASFAALQTAPAPAKAETVLFSVLTFIAN